MTVIANCYTESMAKTYGGNRKWTTGRSRVVRPENQVKLDRGLKESFKMAFDHLTSFGRKKRSWEK